MTTLLGWCVTGHHAHCRHVVWLSQQGRDLTCSCPCHADTTTEPQEAPDDH